MKQKLFLGAQQEHVALHRLASGQLNNLRKRYATVHICTATVHICTRTVRVCAGTAGSWRYSLR
jgi:hypothetical protein